MPVVSGTLPVLIPLLVTLALVSVLAPRLRAPLPVLLALAGFGVASIPRMPHLELHPDLILVMFLPPLLYADAFDTSWVDFKRWLRPIMMLAVVLVALTILAVGWVAHALLPGLPWPVCFLLGAIVSPTDTVAVQAVVERLRVPRRITSIVGGESLVNDATGLVGVQIAVAAILSGTFDPGDVTLSFLRVAGLGVLVGLGIGFLFAQANRLVPDTQILFVLSLLAPYLAFFIAHRLDASGVLAVVIAGFVVAWNIHRIPADARVALYETWTLVVGVITGVCFVLIGLEAPHGLAMLGAEGAGSASGAGGLNGAGGVALAALAVSATVVLVRIAVCFPAAYIPLALSSRLRAREGGFPPWRGVAVVSWCGVRGIVSLAAALAVPVALPDGSPFPGRDTIVACTLVVILVTLVGQGLTLLPLIRLLGLRDEEDTAREVRAAHELVLSAGIERLDAFCSEISCPLSVHHWRALMQDELTTLRDTDAEERLRARARVAVSRDVRRAVAEAQSAALLALRDRGGINDSTYVLLQLELDRAGYGTGGSPDEGVVAS
jgi:monovalent cation/hydrogen antiporter